MGSGTDDLFQHVKVLVQMTCFNTQLVKSLQGLLDKAGLEIKEKQLSSVVRNKNDM
jgi:hypothetical protein